MNKEHFRRILDSVKTAVAVADQNLKIVYFNRAFSTLFPQNKERGKLGEIFTCAENVKKCGASDGCRGCALAGAFEDAFLSNKEISRRIIHKVAGDEMREVCFSLTITPLGGGLCMGAIDDAFELEIARELLTAKNIQQKLLPAGKWAGGKKYSYLYIPCRDIGGDLPDVYECAGDACGVIADVSGKGISAGMLSAFVKAAYDRRADSPAKAIGNLSAKFRELNLDERNYVTVASVKIGKENITYSMAGHNVPILLKTDSGITRIMLNSPPVSTWFDNPSYFDDAIGYKKGDILALLTDGVTECRNERGEMFGVDGAIKTLSYSKTADDFIKNLENNLKTFCSNLNDDITAIAFDL